jgi:hypothetical protein
LRKEWDWIGIDTKRLGLDWIGIDEIGIDYLLVQKNQNKNGAKIFALFSLSFPSDTSKSIIDTN